MQIIFNNKQPRLLGTCTGRRLMPGKNVFEISDDGAPGSISLVELQTIRADRTFQGWQKLAWVAVSQPSAPLAADKGPEDEPDQLGLLDEITVSEAEVLIFACSDLELLAKWHERDKRKGVQKLIEERIQDIETPADDDEG